MAEVFSQSATGFPCSTCRVFLLSLDEQRAHFQTPFHTFNVRRKIVGMVPVSFAQFQEKLHEKTEEETAKVMWEKMDFSSFFFYVFGVGRRA